MKSLGIRQAIKNKWDEHSELMYGVFVIMQEPVNSLYNMKLVRWQHNP
jgi:hypothetical protein